MIKVAIKNGKKVKVINFENKAKLNEYSVVYMDNPFKDSTVWRMRAYEFFTDTMTDEEIEEVINSDYYAFYQAEDEDFDFE